MSNIDTLIDYSAVSDFEINEKIANCGPYKDYCNSWADMGPIIEKYKICFKYNHSGLAVAYEIFEFTYDSDGDPCSYAMGLYHEDKSPLRAACIVFLKMKEGS